MSRLSGLEAGVHGFSVTNLPEEDDVWSLTENVFESLFVVCYVAADFLLGDDTGCESFEAWHVRVFHVVRVLILNRVFDGDDVLWVILANPIDERC